MNFKFTLNEKWLEENLACSEGRAWFRSQKETDALKVLEELRKQERRLWFNWAVARLMNHSQRVEWAIFAAEKVIGIFEKKYPQDDRPRKAIEAAEKWLVDPTEENREAANAAAYAANAANAAVNVAYAASAAANAANAANAVVNVAYATNAKGKIRNELCGKAIEILNREK